MNVTNYLNNIFKISIGDSFRKSCVVCDEFYDFESAYTRPLSDDFIKFNADNSISFINCNLEFLRITQPSVTEYSILKQTGGVESVRKTVDGIKTTISGEDYFIAGTSNHIDLSLKYSDDILFGLGSHEEGYPYLNGHVFHMFQENMRISIPMFVSNKGYAVLIDNGSYMRYDFEKERECSIYIDSAKSLDIYVFTGGLQKVYESYRLLTGITPMLPKYALGYIQSKERYVNQDELLDTVKKYRELGIPLDVIVQDWLYWGDNMWGEKVLDLKRYPDLTSCIDEIHELGAHIMISIWPNMSGGGINQTEFKNAGLLLKDGSVYNAFDSEGRDMYWNQAKSGLFCHGIDAWWCDSSEPYDANWEGTVRRPVNETVNRSVNEFKKYIDDDLINAYSLYHSKGIYEHQRLENPKRVLNLTRSGFAGQHRYGTIVWSGDISASWDTLKKQVHILQNYISTGEAYWNSDVGGFFVKSGEPWFWNGQYNDGVKDENYKKLYLRWLQFAVFTPMMRSHGTDTPREIWQFGAPSDYYFELIKRTIEFRYKLIPYLYSRNAAVTLEGKMPVTPLALAFPNDANSVNYLNEYLYGNEFLVCPVTEPDTDSMDIYLPAGIWYDYHTKKRYAGGQLVTVSISMENIPVFVKAGAIIPTVKVMQYIDQDKDAEYTVEIYEGANGEFNLYNDSGIDYSYEDGEYSLIKIKYDDIEKTVEYNEVAKHQYAHKLTFKFFS